MIEKCRREKNRRHHCRTRSKSILKRTSAMSGNKKKSQNVKKSSLLLWTLLSGFMAACVLAYVLRSSEDVVYSDYIRLVNEYLPNVLDIKKVLVPDILTRTPIAYLFRIVNVYLFHYSVTFDRVLNVLFLMASSVVLLKYGIEEKINRWFLLFLLLLLYSLSKAEMLINGTGYPHYLSYVLFYLHFYLIDHFFEKGLAKKSVLLLCAVPCVTILLVSGPYCAVYAVTVLLIYILLFREKKEISRNDQIILMAGIVVPFLLYLISNSFAVEETPGMFDVSLARIITEAPDYIVRFLLKGFASAAIDGEWLQSMELDGIISTGCIYAFGGLVFLGYLASFYIYFKEGFQHKTLLPLALLLLGFGSHLIVFLGRYAFLMDEYSMSSRYFLQYQQGLLGILLTTALFVRKKTGTGFRKTKDSFLYRRSRAVVVLAVTTIIAGNIASCVYEIQGMRDRKEVFQIMKAVELDYRTKSDDLLNDLFEYGAGAEKIRSAFGILEENQLNVFYDKTEIEER